MNKSKTLIRWLIVTLFAIILILEFSTPNEYVFGYLYIGAILLVNSRLSRKASWQATVIAMVLTLLNIWIPSGTLVSTPTIANRLIAVIAIMVTALLSNRNLQYHEEITQAKAQLNAQEQLVRLREDFASTLTHDLKTPLLGAIETIKALQSSKFGAVSSSQKKVLATIERSHRTSLQLVETLLDIYRNDTEGLKLNRAIVDLAILAEEVTSNLIELASARQIHLNVNYGKSDFRSSLWVNGDAVQLQRVFTNLIVNAIDHSRRGGKVEISLEALSSYQIVKVIDRGMGITKEELPYLFERFYQGHGDRSSKGSGLGLYLSRQIIEAHSGTIWAENQASGGAVFCFKLPVYPFEKNIHS
ncbi:MAG: sensor histidine kinase [Xenococcaceae cyanobacterium]